MTDASNIDLHQLLSRSGVEGERVEFKATWDPKTTGPQVLRTLAAFANDLHNLNGGWVVLGVREVDGRATLPPEGLSDAEIEEAGSWIRGNCQRVEPPIQPRLFDVTFQERRLLVAWMPASDARPHRAPDPRNPERKEFFVRTGAGDVKAQGAILDTLYQLTARVPWDGRRALDREVGDIRPSLVREFLREEGSALADDLDDLSLLRRMDLIARTNGHEVPLNVALLFFTEDPSRYFHGAWIEVVEQPAGSAGDVFERREFRGPLPRQIRGSVDWIEQRFGVQLLKRDDKVEADTWEVFPRRALAEAVSNAVYHRSYEGIDEPTKIVLHADRIEIWSYPGPVPGLRREHLQPGATVPALPARNRRIGEYLRRLRLAEQYRSGVRKIYGAMEANGSPPPRFDWDDERTWFCATLPAHLRYLVLSTLREAAAWRAQGQPLRAIDVLLSAHQRAPGSAPLTAELVAALCAERRLGEAVAAFETFRGASPKVSAVPVAASLARNLADMKHSAEARRVLDLVPGPHRPDDALLLADVERKVGRYARALELFEEAGERVWSSAAALNSLGRTNLGLAEALRGATSAGDKALRRTAIAEAERAFKRVIAYSETDELRGWTWYDLARTLKARRAPREEVLRALDRASALATGDMRLQRAIREL